MKNLLVLVVVCLIALNGCGKGLTVCGTALTVASQAGALSGVPQMGAVNAKQVRAVNSARNAAGVSGVPLGTASGAVGVASKVDAFHSVTKETRNT